MKIDRYNSTSFVFIFSIIAFFITLIERELGGTMLISRILAFISLGLGIINLFFVFKD